MSVEMTGWVSAKKEVKTLKDLRDLVAWADKYKVSDEAIVERNFTHLFIDFLGVPEDAKATWIECGDHLYGDEHWDVLIETHTHPEYEKHEPAEFDWPSRDRLNRYGDETRPE